jgi:DNA-binding NtrC family response regulator
VAKICKVLVVEDDQDIRSLLGDVFEMEGYHFMMAANGDEMRQALATDDDVDVVILDVGLPGSANGLTLAGEVAKRGIGVILVSGYPDHFDSLQVSGHRFLQKPFKLTALLALIEETLQKTDRNCEREGEKSGTCG